MTLSLQAAGSVLDPPARTYQENPADLRFFEDLLERHGQRFDRERFLSGRHVDHRSLTDLLADQDGLRGRTADLIVVAHALPDVLAHGVTASHAALRFGDGVHGFSVADQGLAAPFTGLRIVSAFRASGRARHPVLLVVEQTTLPAHDPVVDDGPVRLVDSGALLAFGEDGPLRLGAGSDEVRVDLPADRLPELIRAQAHPDAGETLVVLGPDAPEPEPVPGGHLHRVPPGSYATSVWIALADNWREWARRFDRVLLCDVDRRRGRGCLATLRCERHEAD
ncbi:hypothetical protein [Streptomyces sulphureus]|uniref:hypothetical protein n=1 Tax=Streptomyces sulphureus TaxID=47758 RepID=UPI000364A8C0|nr:hypothetical protein [Streptomyces sulphureus]